LKQQNSFQKFTGMPKGVITIWLTFLCLVSATLSHDGTAIIHTMIAVLFAVITDLVFIIKQKRQQKLPYGAVVTGLIIGLVLSSHNPLWTPIFASIIAILSKNILKFRHKPIFNPATFGLLVSAGLGVGQNWWGAMSTASSWSLILVIAVGFYIASRVNKFRQVFSFLFTYFVLLLLFGLTHNLAAADMLRSPLVNTALFFAFFMLTDPPTTPAKTQGQILFGALVGLISATIATYMGGLVFLFIGLLLMNLVFSLEKQYKPFKLFTV
jgi:Na+-translocating ferredoxin:NAD+ oxidoreductase RnfD subunit